MMDQDGFSGFDLLMHWKTNSHTGIERTKESHLPKSMSM